MRIKMKLISTVAFVMAGYLCAAPAWATCGVGGYWGSECGQQPGTTTPTTGGSTNTATGGSSTSDATAGAIGVGVGYGGSVGDTTATSGSTSTATGGNVTGSGNSSSTSTATGGAGGHATAGVTGSGNSSSRSGVSGSGNSNVSVHNSTKIKHAASTAAPVMLNGYGPGNCFGDTNPSGSFGASMQTFGWGVSASRSKASNVCAAYAIAGPQGAIGYLAQQDPMFREVAIANGWAVTKSEAKRRNKVAAEPAPVAQTVRCPEGSTWDGRGCYAKNIKAVKRN